MGRRFLGFAVLALCLFLLARAAAAAPLPHAPSQAKPLLLRSQEQVGKDLIALILRADFPAARAYFDTSVRKNVTEETFRGVQTQIKELAGAAGDSVEQASTGETVAQHWGPIFFREYRFVNEVGKGAPGALINVSFNDSTSDKVLGLFIKRLVEVSKSGQISTYRGQEKTLAGAQKWSIGGQEVDVNEIVLLDFREGHMLSIKVIDKEAEALTMPAAKRKAVPIVKAAIAKGILKRAKAETPDLMDRIGVAFIIPDGSGGFRAQLEPSEYD
jgi:hypothetical protein